jgi:hypothetical protein
MADLEGSFKQLSANRDQFGRDYLRSDVSNGDFESERHYRCYVQMVEELHPEKAFSDVAAVTDLYYCAYPANDRNTHVLGYIPLRWNSLCSDTFFKRVLVRVQPKVIITRGGPPKKISKENSQIQEVHAYRIVSSLALTLVVCRLPFCRSDGETSTGSIRRTESGLSRESDRLLAESTPAKRGANGFG